MRQSLFVYQWWVRVPPPAPNKAPCISKGFLFFFCTSTFFRPCFFVFVWLRIHLYALLNTLCETQMRNKLANLPRCEQQRGIFIYHKPIIQSRREVRGLSDQLPNLHGREGRAYAKLRHVSYRSFLPPHSQRRAARSCFFSRSEISEGSYPF